MMYHIPGVLSAQDVAWFREQLDAADWIDGRATTGAQGAQVKNNQQVDTQSERYGVLQQAVQTAVNNSPLFFAAALPKTLSTPLFNRYQDMKPTVFTLTARYVVIRKTAGCAQTFPPPYSSVIPTIMREENCWSMIPTASTR